MHQRAEALHHKPSADTEGDAVDLDVLEELLSSTPDLGYPLDVALLLWRGWEDHGVMAVSGGILDQPRKWRRLISLITRRAQAHEDAVKAGYVMGGVFDGAGNAGDLIG